ncbi:MAG TPA: hypothetical protein VHW26_12895 [Solirubrobacteraceae bacterium]|nr:hypothetical protein [Solirubrobacteraceae bacterium]
MPVGACARLRPARPVRDRWDIDSNRQIETDPEKSSEIEVRFVAEGPRRTRGELEHRNLERHGDGWEAHHDAVGPPGGWARGLRRFAHAVESAEA